MLFEVPVTKYLFTFIISTSFLWKLYRNENKVHVCVKKINQLLNDGLLHARTISVVELVLLNQLLWFWVGRGYKYLLKRTRILV